jgi:hypothetical protein
VLIGHLAMALSRTEMLGRGTPHPFIFLLLFLCVVLMLFFIDADIWMIHVGAGATVY